MNEAGETVTGAGGLVPRLIPPPCLAKQRGILFAAPVDTLDASTYADFENRGLCTGVGLPKTAMEMGVLRVHWAE